MRGCRKDDNPILHYDTFNATLRHRTDAAHCHENSRFSVIFMCITMQDKAPPESECAIFQWPSRTISSAPPKKESGRSLIIILKDYATDCCDHNVTYNFSALSNTWTIGWQNSTFSIKKQQEETYKRRKKGHTYPWFWAFFVYLHEISRNKSSHSLQNEKWKPIIFSQSFPFASFFAECGHHVRARWIFL